MDQNLMWIIIGLILIILLVVVIVAVGNKRRKDKTVSFDKTEERDPKELTQEEKSGNYQAQGGFNFAPAQSPDPADKPEKEAIRVDKPVEEPAVSESERLSSASAAVAGGASAETVAGAASVSEPHREAEAEAEPEVVAEPAGETPSREAEVEVTPETARAADAVSDREPEAEEPAVEEPAVEEPVAEEPAVEEPVADEPVAEEKAPAEGVAEEDAAQAEAEQAAVSEAVAKQEEAEEAAAIAAVTAEVVADAREQTELPEDGPLESPEPAEPLDEIAPAAGRIGKLRGRLARSQNAIGQGLLGILSAGDLDEDAWEEIEDTLIMADLGAPLTMKVTELLRAKIAERGVSSEAEARAMLRETLIEVGRPELDRSVRALPSEGKPAVILVVGVNGTGKTTTTGKLARVLVSMGSTVVLGAADTFRAAAADQLETWGRRVGATTVRGKEGADPASVAFDAVARGVQEQADVVIVDTAGRLHTSTDLMDQLGKVKRVVEKKSAVDEVLLVLDATVGQNGLTQARVFRDVVDITGVVLTKLDGTAKGGIVFQVQEELGVPVKLVGLGEGADDLAPFEVEGFVDALLG